MCSCACRHAPAEALGSCLSCLSLWARNAVDHLVCYNSVDVSQQMNDWLPAHWRADLLMSGALHFLAAQVVAVPSLRIVATLHTVTTKFSLHFRIISARLTRCFLHHPSLSPLSPLPPPPPPGALPSLSAQVSHTSCWVLRNIYPEPARHIPVCTALHLLHAGCEVALGAAAASASSCDQGCGEVPSTQKRAHLEGGDVAPPAPVLQVDPHQKLQGAEQGGNSMSCS